MMNYLNFALLAVLVLVLPGCTGKPDPYKVYTVTGIVTLDDEPVEGVSVTFIPVNAGGTSMSASSITDASGRYNLTTSGCKKPGAMEGNYNVIFSKVTIHEMTDEERTQALLASQGGAMPASKGAKQEIPQMYQVPGKSGFQVQVEPNDKNSFDFPLSGK